MRKIIASLTLLCIGFLAQAQHEFEELIILKADQNWEKLIRQAEKATQKTKTKDDPEPYYYMAYGLYKISFIGDRPDEFKNAYKDALSIVGKLGRKDSDNEVQDKYNEFFIELKMSLLEIIRNDIEADDYRRAFGWVMKIYKFDRDHIAGKYLEAACRFRNGDKATARTKINEGKALIDALESTSHWDEADKEMIKFALYEAAKAQRDARQKEAAVDIMSIGAQWFEEDEDWKRYYDDIVN